MYIRHVCTSETLCRRLDIDTKIVLLKDDAVGTHFIASTEIYQPCQKRDPLRVKRDLIKRHQRPITRQKRLFRRPEQHNVTHNHIVRRDSLLFPTADHGHYHVVIDGAEVRTCVRK